MTNRKTNRTWGNGRYGKYADATIAVRVCRLVHDKVKAEAARRGTSFAMVYETAVEAIAPRHGRAVARTVDVDVGHESKGGEG